MGEHVLECAAHSNDAVLEIVCFMGEKDPVRSVCL